MVAAAAAYLSLRAIGKGGKAFGGFGCFVAEIWIGICAESLDQCGNLPTVRCARELLLYVAIHHKIGAQRPPRAKKESAVRLL